MKTQLIIFAASIVGFLFVSALAFGGEWKKPPAIRVQQGGDGSFFLRNLSETETVEIWDSESMVRVWNSRVPGYSADFSAFFLSDDGEYLVHVRTNHMVNSIDDICLEVFGRDGFRDTYKVNEVHTKLPLHPFANSALPNYAWHAHPTRISPQMYLYHTGAERSPVMVVQLGSSRVARFAIGKHAVEVE